MSDPAANAASMADWLNVCVNGRELDSVEEYVHSEYLSHWHLEEEVGADAERVTLRRFFKAFPDFNYDYTKIIAQRDMVAVYGNVSGTFEAEYDGVEPTGKKFDVFSIEFCRFQDGLAIEHWGVFDTPRYDNQLGTVSTETPAQVVEANVALATEFVDAVYSKRNSSAAESYAHNNFSNPTVKGAPSGVEALVAEVTSVLETYPDLTIEIENVVAEDDRVGITGTAQGHRRGTHEKFGFVAFFKISDTKLLEHWVLLDQVDVGSLA